MKVTIDREECTMCGICWDVCSDFFQQNDDDEFSEVVEKYRIDGDNSKGEVPGDLEDCAREGAEGCPVDIIHLEE